MSKHLPRTLTSRERQTHTVAASEFLQLIKNLRKSTISKFANPEANCRAYINNNKELVFTHHYSNDASQHIKRYCHCANEQRKQSG